MPSSTQSPSSTHSIDQIERDQRHRTRQRREHRSRRRKLYLFGVFAFLALLVLGLPSLVSKSGYSKSLLSGYANDYGFDVNADEVRIGWVTPLRLSGITAVGLDAGSEIELEQLDSEITILDLIRGNTNDLGSIDLRGLRIRCTIANGRCSLEDDFEKVLSDQEQTPTDPSDSDDATKLTSKVRLQDLVVVVSDVSTGQAWTLDQASIDADLDGSSMNANLVCVLREPNGSEGSLQGQIASLGGLHVNAPESSVDPRQVSWTADMMCETIPLSFVSLIEQRFRETIGPLPADIRGDLSGQAKTRGFADGIVDVSLRGVEVRNFAASQPSSIDNAADPGRLPSTAQQIWHNELATLEGDLVLRPATIMGRGLVFQSDFASASFDGEVANSITFSGSEDNPLRFLDRIDGLIDVQLDLARLNTALPGLLPTREDAEIVRGRIRGRIESLDSTTMPRSRLLLKSDPIEALANGKSVVVAPLTMTAVVADDNGHLVAEKFEVTSDFAFAEGSGDLQRGSADVKVDFGKLAANLRPILDLSDVQMQGSVSGRLDWKVDANDRWRLVGQGRGQQLALTLPDGSTIIRDTVDATADAVGVWNGRELEELSNARIKLASDGLNIQAGLTNAVQFDDREAVFPIRVIGSGPVGTLVDVARSWIPDAIEDADGSFQLSGDGSATTSSVQLTSLDVDLRQPRLLSGDSTYRQPNLAIRYLGQTDLTTLVADIDTLTITGDNVSAIVSGNYAPERVDLQVDWHADLQSLNASVKPRIAQRDAVQQVNFTDEDRPVDQTPWVFKGDLDGRMRIKTIDRMVVDDETLPTAATYLVDAKLSGRDVGIFEQPSAGERQGRTVWSEGDVDVVADWTLDPETMRVDSRSTEITGDWFATKLDGYAVWTEQVHDVRLNGPTSIKIDQIATLLSAMTGTEINAIGEHRGPVKIRIGKAKAGGVAFDVSGSLGWEQARIAGIRLGESNIPFHMTESTLHIDRTAIPVGGGHVDPAGLVYYQAEPMWVQLEPGVLAENVSVSPEMADTWLKYLAPVVADAARIDGTFGCEIEEGMLVIDDPAQSRVIGRLNINEVQMNSGPMTTQIISGLDTLRGIAGLAGGGQPRDRANTNLITMPPQQVDFQVDRGQVTHRRLVMQIDRAEVFTGGVVGMDGQLNMVAQVPLDDRWLGSDLRSLSGETLRLPIQGTIWQPRLDNREMQRAMAGMGQKAVQGAVDGYLDKGRQKVEEEILRGLDKLNLGPLLGR